MPAKPQVETSAPIGLNLTSPGNQLESFAAIVDHFQSLGSDVAEVPYRYCFTDQWHRILELSGHDICMVREQVRRFDRVSFHGPIGNVLMTNPDVQRATLQSLRQTIQEAALIGAEVMALHIEPLFPNLEFNEGQLKRTAELLRELTEFASCYNVRVGLETEYPNTIETFLALIDTVDHPNFGATLDVGHLFDRRVPYHTYINRDLLRSEDGPHAYNAMLQGLANELIKRGKLFHMHIHQQRQEALSDQWPWATCDHWTLDQGFIDIPALFRLLRQADYQGIIICELARGKSAKAITDQEKKASLAIAKKWWLEAGPTNTASEV